MSTDYEAVAAIFDQMGWDKVADFGFGPSDQVQDAVDGLESSIQVVDADGGDLSFFIPSGFTLSRQEGPLAIYERTISRCNPRRNINRRWTETQTVYVARGDTKAFVCADF